MSVLFRVNNCHWSRVKKGLAGIEISVAAGGHAHDSKDPKHMFPPTPPCVWWDPLDGPIQLKPQVLPKRQVAIKTIKKFWPAPITRVISEDWFILFLPNLCG